MNEQFTPGALGSAFVVLSLALFSPNARSQEGQQEERGQEEEKTKPGEERPEEGIRMPREETGKAPAREMRQTERTRMITTPRELTWKDAPEALPAGAKMAVLSGDPAKEGPFIVRFRIPRNYRIPAHTHPGDEYVTVIEGSFHIGMGDKLDEKVAEELKTGGFAAIPADMHHFAFSKRGGTIQIQGMGPWDVKYLNPSDDPRQQARRGS